MSSTPKRGHKALRHGRWSSPDSEYFLTVVTGLRKSGLVPVGAELTNLARAMESEGVWSVRTLTIMPDHVHLLVTLGTGSTLSSALRTFKGRTANVLRRAGLKWQKGFFDHRLRDGEDRLPVFLYIFLNPYRAGMIHRSEHWSGYYCAAEDWEWFEALTMEGCPFPEWLASP